MKRLVRRIRVLVLIVVATMLLIPFWIFVIAPQLTKIPSDFTYKASVFSRDNFYDEQQRNFTSDTISDTIFGYLVIGKKEGVLLIKNYFSVRKFSGEKIIELERIYGIDPKTGQHVPGYGDRDREGGYLFAPRNLQREQEFTYWHINYDAPALMKFQGEEIIDGLIVYRYAADYHADQTESLGHLPEVPETRGVNLDVNLQVWVEPETGRMIKYEDKTNTYYYSISTGERLHPWNKFNNRFNEISVDEQIGLAKEEKLKLFLVETVIPLALSAFALLMVFILAWRKEMDAKE